MSHHPVNRSARARVVPLMLLVVLVAVAAAAVPAAATPTPTTFTLNAQRPTVDWGATAILNGMLQTAENPPLPVDQQMVMVMYSASATPPWNMPADGTITNTATPYSSGEYTYSFKASRNFYWQMSFAGTVAYAAKDSNIVLVKVKPVIGKPSCPSSIKHGRKFTVSGSLKPRYPSGSRNVSIKAQRYSSGHWRAYKTYTATATNSGAYSEYSLRFSISKTGKYRFYATTANTTTLAAGKSAFSRSMLVK